ncbi:MAG: hypothetical protein K2X81_07160, partial [Candidatus Obscuribacterales bacterium]|nr:hypothetical protein [Candidatus Obscuribacterales bacterium]
MKKFFKKHSGLIIALLAIVGAAIYVVMQLAKAGNTPEDKQLSAFGGADHPAAITEMTDLVRHHPERVIKVHRQIAAGSAFAERIAIEAKNDGDKLGSLWSITTQTDDQSLMAVITETNHALEGAHRGVIPVVNEA